MNLKVFSSLPATVSLPGSDEVITNCWPLPRSPKEVNPQGIPILFREEEVGQLSAEPIAWPCDDATSRWISEDGDEPFPGAPDDPEADQPFEF
jgi:hypothetical protein